MATRQGAKAPMPSVYFIREVGAADSACYARLRLYSLVCVLCSCMCSRRWDEALCLSTDMK